jgi:uncharacterized OB-fold protein
MTGERGEPAADAVGSDRAFAAHVSDGRLWLQRCGACGACVFYPRALCSACGASRLDWFPASGRGVVYARAALHRRARPGDPPPQPHCVVLVDLEEGPRLMSRLPGLAAEAVRIGMAVRARIEAGADAPVVVFDPVEAQP